MFSIALIVFRETLEIALILTVIYAASRGRQGRGLWTALGLLGGAIGAGVVALFAEALTAAAEGMGQELFNALILFAAAALIGSTAVWMKLHARDAALHLKETGAAVREGKLPLYSLSIVIALAVWREGSEIVLFLYGMAISGYSATVLISGSALGLLAGCVMGAALYRGLLKIAAKHLFRVTGWLLVLLSAGMASQGAKLLADAGVFTHLVTPLWSTASLLPQESIAGQALHALLGYSARPLGIQVVFYLATLAVLISAIVYFGRASRKTHMAAAGILLALTCTPDAHALDGEIYSPRIVKNEMELEYAGVRTLDSDKSKNNQQTNEFSASYGFTDWFLLELAGALERGPGEPQDYTGTELQTRFQLWDTNKYWLDAGVLLAYHSAAKRNDADSVETKLLLQKDFGRVSAIANFGGERTIGTHSDDSGNELSAGLQTVYRINRYISPGIEYQADLGTWHDHLTLNQQGHYAGPVIIGELLPGLKYQAAYLRGLTGGAATSAIRTQLEYEILF